MARALALCASHRRRGGELAVGRAAPSTRGSGSGCGRAAIAELSAVAGPRASSTRFPATAAGESAHKPGSRLPLTRGAGREPDPHGGGLHGRTGPGAAASTWTAPAGRQFPSFLPRSAGKSAPGWRGGRGGATLKGAEALREEPRRAPDAASVDDAGGRCSPAQVGPTRQKQERGRGASRRRGSLPPPAERCGKRRRARSYYPRVASGAGPNGRAPLRPRPRLQRGRQRRPWPVSTLHVLRGARLVRPSPRPPLRRRLEQDAAVLHLSQTLPARFTGRKGVLGGASSSTPAPPS